MSGIAEIASAGLEALPPKTADLLERCAVNIESLRSKGVELIFAMGRELKVAHDALANHGDGTFGKWCKERCGITRSCAHNYLSAVDAFGASSSKALTNFTAESLYLLSRDSTPQEAVEAAVTAAESGERISLAKAKEIIEEVVAEESEELEAEQSQAYDYLDQPISTELAQVFADEALVDEAIGHARAALASAATLHKSPAGKFLNLKQVRSCVKELQALLEYTRPFAICPYCEGRKCSACAQVGIVPKEVHQQAQ